MLLIMFTVFLILLMLGMPVAFAMAIAGSVVIFSLDIDTSIIPRQMFDAVDSFPLMAIPFFILTGAAMNASGMTQRIVTFASDLVGRFRGDLANVNIMSSTMMSGFSGSATADAVAVGSVMIPAMERRGYDRGFSAGITAASACIGPIIPPSVVMVIYAAMTGLSVGTLFFAGIIPGLLVCVGLLAVVQVVARRRGWPRGHWVGWRQLRRSAASAFLALGAPVIVLGGIIAGIATATEAGAIAALYSLIIGTFVYRELPFRQYLALLTDVAVKTAVPVIIIVGASVFGWVVASEGLAADMTNAIGSLAVPDFVTMLLVIALLLVIGLFVEGLAALIIFVPVLFPVGAELGLDPIHWAIVIIVTILLGTITPPVGLQLYIAGGIARVPISKIYIWPFVAVILGVILLTSFIPPLATWTPSLFAP